MGFGRQSICTFRRVALKTAYKVEPESNLYFFFSPSVFRPFFHSVSSFASRSFSRYDRQKEAILVSRANDLSIILHYLPNANYHFGGVTEKNGAKHDVTR